MQRFVEEDPFARDHLNTARELDLLLDDYQPVLPDLSARIMQAIPESALERLLRWLLPDAGEGWWRPVTACALPLLLGVAIGFGQTGALSAGGEYSSLWEEQERYLLAPQMSGDWYE
jgi:hypothetical protein